MRELPRGWAWATVGDVASLTDGPFGSNLKTSHYVDRGPRVVRLQNIGDGFFRDEHAHITLEHFERLQKHSVRGGDVVVASLGADAPRACLVPDSLGPAIVKADCIRVRAEVGVVPAFLMWMLNAPMTRRRAAEVIKGIGRPRLGLGGIRSLVFGIPPTNEQLRIVATLDQLFSRLDAVGTTIELLIGAYPTGNGRLGALRRGILSRAYSGELVPHDPNDEPASVLLERITTERAAAAKPGRKRREKTSA